jgi:hypothetical protein
MPKLSWWILWVILLVVVGLPLAGHLARRKAEIRCALDGGRIEPIYRVRIVDDKDLDYEFCCIRCAEIWLQSCAQLPAAIYVTDEATGTEIDSTQAVFVRSSVVTNSVTDNRIHVFANLDQGEQHASHAFGHVLPTSERPFAGGGGSHRGSAP